MKNISSLSNFYAAFRFLREHFGLPDDDDDLGSEVRRAHAGQKLGIVQRGCACGTAEERLWTIPSRFAVPPPPLSVGGLDLSSSSSFIGLATQGLPLV